MVTPEIPGYFGDGRVRLLKIARVPGRRYPLVVKWSTGEHLVQGDKVLLSSSEEVSTPELPAKSISQKQPQKLISDRPNDLLSLALALSMSYRLKEVAYLFMSHYAGKPISELPSRYDIAISVLEKLKPILTYDRDEIDLNELVNQLILKGLDRRPPTDEEVIDVYLRSRQAFRKAFDDEARNIAMRVLDGSLSRRKLQAYLDSKLKSDGFRSIVISSRGFVFAGAALPGGGSSNSKKYAVVVGRIVDIISEYKGHQYMLVEIPSPDGKPRKVLISNSFKSDAGEPLPSDMRGKWILIKGEYIAESGKLFYRRDGEVSEEDLVGVIHFTHMGGLPRENIREIGEGVGGFVTLDISPSGPLKYELDFYALNPKLVKEVLASKLTANGVPVKVEDFLRMIIREYPSTVTQVPPGTEEAYDLIRQAEEQVPNDVKALLFTEALAQLSTWHSFLTWIPGALVPHVTKR